MFENRLEQLKLKKIDLLNKLGKGAYKHNIKRDITIKKFIDRFSYLHKSDTKRDESKDNNIIGRIKFIRPMGKAIFLKVEDSSGILQVYINKKTLGEEWFDNFKKIVDVGDIVYVKGYPFCTRTDELTLYANSIDFITKSVLPFPEKFHGLQDKDLKYKLRYLDMIMNRDLKNTFIDRSKIIRIVRDFFQNMGFLEVETPMLHPIAGGAIAKPFITYYESLKSNKFLRIAPELYLKRLIVGGFDAIFEINKNFRNEGIDHTHNPEFTMLEFYWTYHTYDDLMSLSEKMFSKILEELKLPKKIKYLNMDIDFRVPFKRISYYSAISTIGNIPEDIIYDKGKILSFLYANKSLNLNQDTKDMLSKYKLIQLQEFLFDNFVEKNIIDPTFIVDFPTAISPLARQNSEDTNISERFELIIAKMEIANGFNELNNPVEQYNRFQKQLKNKNQEHKQIDKDYIRALGYGMPPTAGEGIGIDRLIMLLTNKESIKDVILFPTV